jgi:hypothetical protein
MGTGFFGTAVAAITTMACREAVIASEAETYGTCPGDVRGEAPITLSEASAVGKSTVLQGV